MMENIRYILMLGFLGIFVVKFGVTLTFLLFILGGVVGFHLFEIEGIFKQLLESKPLSVSNMRTAVSRESSSSLISQRVLFPLYFLIAFLIITSTGSVIGAAFILGLGLRFTWELVNHSSDVQFIHSKYLKNVLQHPTARTLRYISWGFIAVFGGLSLLVLL